MLRDQVTFHVELTKKYILRPHQHQYHLLRQRPMSLGTILHQYLHNATLELHFLTIYINPQ